MKKIPENVTVKQPESNGKIFELVRGLTLAAMTADSPNQVDSLGVGVAAVAGALHGVAAICGQREGIDHESPPDEQRSTINDTSALVAALLVAKATHDTKDFLALQLNPLIYLAVLKAAETLLGHNIDDQLNPNLVSAARRWESENGYFGSWKDQTLNEDDYRRSPLH